MATRKRTIQPTIWQDPDFGLLTPIAQLVFLGLITQADDEGRFNGHPAVVRSAIFPYGMVDLDVVFDALQEIIRRMRNLAYYEVNGSFYGQFLKWHDHQVLREDRMQKSVYPPPPKNQMSGRCQASGGQAGTEVSKEVSKTSKDCGGKNFPNEHPLDQVRRELEASGHLKKKTLM